MSAQKSMKAVIFDGPYKISVQDRPIPQLLDDKDIIVKVSATALCGSELHVFRGHEKADPGFIMGHEFVGTVVKAGAAVQAVKVGDKVVTPFTTSCGECFYCNKGLTSRCESSLLFGSGNLDGGQAEYVRVPYADGTVLKAPGNISDKACILMADIFPTGFYGVKSAVALCPNLDIKEATIVVVGCGPVGLCAVVSALDLGAKQVFAIDSVESRLALAKKLGAEPLNFASDKDGMFARVRDATNGRGADLVVEVVGNSPALRTAFDLVRPFGAISSIGVHSAEIPWSGSEGYDKNLRFQMGRCPVRQVFPEALALLAKKQDSFDFMFDNEMPLSQAVEAYQLFETRQVQKVVFTPDN